MLVYNGTHWVNTPMSYIKPDLSAYATKDSLSGYMPKTGGTFSGSITAPTFIGSLNGTAASANTLNPIYIIDANAAGNGYSWINPYATGKNVPTAGNLISLENGQNSATQLLSKYSDDTLYYRAKIGEDTWTDWEKIIHTGNLNDLSLARGAHLVNNVDFNDLKSGIYDNEIGNGSGNLNAPSGEEGLYGVLVALSAASPFNFAAQFNVHNSGNIQTRGCYANTWSPWKTIAFTDSNVASATKLQTARTLWGQSFDGTGNVDGDMTIYDGSITIKSRGGNASTKEILFVSSDYYNGVKVVAEHATWASRKDLVIYTSNNEVAPYEPKWAQAVRIGYKNDVTLAATKIKVSTPAISSLDATNGSANAWNVNYNAMFESNNNALTITVDGTQNVRHAMIQVGHSNGGYAGTLGDLYINPLGGNVGIGTTAPSEKLHVNGSVRIGDAILSWDATNKCVTIKNANTGEKASLVVDGGVTATDIN